MLTGINIYETKPYKSKLDKESDKQTVFHIGLLDAHLRAYIDDQTTSFEVSSQNPKDLAKANIQASKHNLLLVKFGLKGMEDYLDPRDNKPIKFDTTAVSVNGKSYNVVSDSILAVFPKALIDELAGIISGENALSEGETKN
jgi:hypothetical protein